MKMGKINRRIYAICGKKGHGKDTLANAIISHNETYQIVSHAKELKNMCSSIFNIEENYFFDSSLKEKQFDTPINIDDYIDEMNKITGLDLDKAGLKANSPRELLQYVGTEYVRNKDEDYWAKILWKSIEYKEKILIPDLRFKNEVKFAIENHASIVKIIRLDFDNENTDDHLSENDIKNIRPDLTIATKNGDLSIVNYIGYLLCNNRLHHAKKYDWNRVKKLFRSGKIMREKRIYYYYRDFYQEIMENRCP